MQNVEMKRAGNKLTITVDLSAPRNKSASGKTDIVASTKGNVDVPGTKGFKLGVNLYAYADAALDA